MLIIIEHYSFHESSEERGDYAHIHFSNILDNAIKIDAGLKLVMFSLDLPIFMGETTASLRAHGDGSDFKDKLARCGLAMFGKAKFRILAVIAS